MNKDLIAIFEYLEKEKGIKREVIISAIEDALYLAAKKSIKNINNPSVYIDPKTGNIDVFTQKKIVTDVQDSTEEISIEEAQNLAPDCELGQVLEIMVTPREFGRIAAQTARQVIAQKIKGAERDVIYEEYRHRVNEIISGSVKRVLYRKTLVIDLGKVEAIMPEQNYPKTESYDVGDKVQALLLEVRDTDNEGAEVVLSRSSTKFVEALFSQEVPEVADEIIKIEKIVREPGYRTKLVVSSSDPKIDPVGTCVGVKGNRIKNIIRELNNEKIDVIPYSDNINEFLSDVFSPIEILRLKENEENVNIIINDEDYPAVIGKKGMNARLVAKLIDKQVLVQKISEYTKLMTVYMAELANSDNPILMHSITELKGISKLLLDALKSSGFDTIQKVIIASPVELAKKVPGLNYLDIAEKILDQSKV